MNEVIDIDPPRIFNLFRDLSNQIKKGIKSNPDQDDIVWKIEEIVGMVSDIVQKVAKNSDVLSILEYEYKALSISFYENVNTNFPKFLENLEKCNSNITQHYRQVFGESAQQAAVAQNSLVLPFSSLNISGSTKTINQSASVNTVISGDMNPVEKEKAAKTKIEQNLLNISESYENSRGEIEKIKEDLNIIYNAFLKNPFDLKGIFTKILGDFISIEKECFKNWSDNTVDEMLKRFHKVTIMLLFHMEICAIYNNTFSISNRDTETLSSFEEIQISLTTIPDCLSRLDNKNEDSAEFLSETIATFINTLGGSFYNISPEKIAAIQKCLDKFIMVLNEYEKTFQSLGIEPKKIVEIFNEMIRKFSDIITSPGFFDFNNRMTIFFSDENLQNSLPLPKEKTEETDYLKEPTNKNSILDLFDRIKINLENSLLLNKEEFFIKIEKIKKRITFILEAASKYPDDFEGIFNMLEDDRKKLEQYIVNVGKTSYYDQFLLDVDNYYILNIPRYLDIYIKKIFNEIFYYQKSVVFENKDLINSFEDMLKSIKTDYAEISETHDTLIKELNLLKLNLEKANDDQRIKINNFIIELLEELLIIGNGDILSVGLVSPDLLNAIYISIGTTLYHLNKNMAENIPIPRLRAGYKRSTAVPYNKPIVTTAEFENILSGFVNISLPEEKIKAKIEEKLLNISKSIKFSDFSENMKIISKKITEMFEIYEKNKDTLKGLPVVVLDKLIDFEKNCSTSTHETGLTEICNNFHSELESMFFEIEISVLYNNAWSNKVFDEKYPNDKQISEMLSNVTERIKKIEEDSNLKIPKESMPSEKWNTLAAILPSVEDLFSKEIADAAMRWLFKFEKYISNLKLSDLNFGKIIDIFNKMFEKINAIFDSGNIESFEKMKPFYQKTALHEEENDASLWYGAVGGSDPLIAQIYNSNNVYLNPPNEEDTYKKINKILMSIYDNCSDENRKSNIAILQDEITGIFKLYKQNTAYFRGIFNELLKDITSIEEELRNNPTENKIDEALEEIYRKTILLLFNMEVCNCYNKLPQETNVDALVEKDIFYPVEKYLSRIKDMLQGIEVVSDFVDIFLAMYYEMSPFKIKALQKCLNDFIRLFDEYYGKFKSLGIDFKEIQNISGEMLRRLFEEAIIPNNYFNMNNMMTISFSDTDTNAHNKFSENTSSSLYHVSQNAHLLAGRSYGSQPDKDERRRLPIKKRPVGPNLMDEFNKFERYTNVGRGLTFFPGKPSNTEESSSAATKTVNVRPSESDSLKSDSLKIDSFLSAIVSSLPKKSEDSALTSEELKAKIISYLHDYDVDDDFQNPLVTIDRVMKALSHMYHFNITVYSVTSQEMETILKIDDKSPTICVAESKNYQYMLTLYSYMEVPSHIKTQIEDAPRLNDPILKNSPQSSFVSKGM